jgi:spore photoproduct lyase
MNSSFENIYNNLPGDVREKLDSLFSSLHFTEMQKTEIVKEEADLVQWDEESFVKKTDISPLLSRRDGRGGDEYMKAMRAYMSSLRATETDYSSFFPPRIIRPKTKEVILDQKIVLSRCPCPVDGEKTRCCRLRTLDAIMQCGFGCSYCSVQAFYNENQIRIVSNLDKKLDELEIDEGVWHIGTGQASDSLLYGDDYSTLSALARFCEKHPKIVIELKSKAYRTDVFGKKWPKNMVFTWSLNAPTIIGKEEHCTAPLEKRIECARIARDNGNRVGFHIHPMFYFRGWEEEYKKVVSSITSAFSPDDIVMISMGTLTFTKAVIQHLRECGRKSRVLEMELEKTAGKYSYPLEKKEKMFSTLYSCFPQSFRDNVFFYLCMEDPTLWMKVLGREYSCDREFESDMRRAYYKKLGILE